MKYYSEITKQLYDSKEDLVQAEVDATKAKSDRAAAAKKVTELLKEAKEANRKANQALDDFIKKYGTFKTTLKADDLDKNREDIFDFWFPF